MPSSRPGGRRPPRPNPPPPPPTPPAPTPSPLPIVLPPRASPSGRGPALRTVRGPPAREPGTVVLRVRGPNRRWVGELDAAAYGAFNLDGGSDHPGGELALCFRRSCFGAAARGSVERDWSASAQSSAGPIALDIRRFTVPVGLHAALAGRVGPVQLCV